MPLSACPHACSCASKNNKKAVHRSSSNTAAHMRQIPRTVPPAPLVRKKRLRRHGNAHKTCSSTATSVYPHDAETDASAHMSGQVRYHGTSCCAAPLSKSRYRFPYAVRSRFCCAAVQTARLSLRLRHCAAAGLPSVRERVLCRAIRPFRRSAAVRRR